MNSIYTCHYESPLGAITMASNGKGLLGLWFDGQKYFAASMANKEHIKQQLPIFQATAQWLDVYFSGKDPGFLPQLIIETTPFRREVWEILLTIPYGKTMTYGDIAEIIAEKKGIAKMSAQAVGGAIGHNSISLIIPCHRVLGKNGSLTGYAGGIEKKIWLLKHEGIEVMP